jgi:hypothetical protein
LRARPSAAESPPMPPPATITEGCALLAMAVLPYLLRPPVARGFL